MAPPRKTPQRPLWQQLGIWVVALVVSAGLITASNDALTETPSPPVPTEQPEAPDTSGNAPSEPDGDSGSEATEPDVADSATEYSDENPEDNPSTDSSPGEGDTAIEQLATLPISARVSRDGYNREEQFGSAWIDVDANGCDTRNDILRRDLDDTVIDSRCRVLTGVLTEPITGDTIFFERGQDTSALVQIDHIVSLSNAWQTGAQDLTRDQRVAFANDPLNLMAISGRLNQQKGDSDAASWLPPRSEFWCEYVARQIGVKAHYSLWVTQVEHDQMRRVLESCPGFPALTPAEHRTVRPGNIPAP